MDLEVVGRHALFFDDDSMAAFVNSGDALVDWNSLQIDRYDVRHLLSGPPPSRRRSHSSSSSSSSNLIDASIQLELDHERYLDLPSPSDEQEVEEGEELADAGAYRAVGFSYENSDDFADRKSSEAQESSDFRPSFPVPESLLQCLPPTEKLHQIIARTALFVSKHGGQSEIVLRVKQGGNPTFGFLMPDHGLHAYFRFLVDHPKLLQSDSELNTQSEGKNTSNEHKEHNGLGGALSMLGSVYGFGEDDEPANGDDPGSRVSSAAVDALDASNISRSLERAETSSKVFEIGEKEKDEKVTTDSLRSSKDKEKALKKNNLINASKSGNRSSTLKEDDFSSSAASEKTKAEISGLGAVSKTGPLVEPPSELKRLIDKIVEFILKNGKQFESTLMEQDSKHGRFPFLLPSNQYHPYYLKILQKAQESKVHGSEKRSSLKGSDSTSSRSAEYDLPYVFDKKEKFKMVIGKSKKETQDSLTKTSQPEVGVNVDAAAAAAILQAATRGIKNPNLSVISGSSKNGDSQGHSSEGGQASSFLNVPPSGLSIFGQRSDKRMEHSVSIPKVKEIAKSAAVEAASEADSSEAHLSKEQKLKAERLRRAKMFVALLKGGTAPAKRDSLGGSVEPQESAFSGSVTEVNVATREREGSAALTELTAVEREGSTAPLDNIVSNENEKPEMKHTAEEQERRSRRKYRSRSDIHKDEDEEEEGQEEDEEEEQLHSRKKRRSSRKDEEAESGEVMDDKRSRKKRRSRRHRHKDGENAGEDEYDEDNRRSRRHRHKDGENAGEDEDDEDNRRSRKKHRRRHSSPEDDDEQRDAERHHKHGRKKHSSHRSSRENRKDDYEGDYKHSKKKHRSHRTSHHSRDRHEHRTKDSSDAESDRSHRTSHRSKDRHTHRTKHSSDDEPEHKHKCASSPHNEEQRNDRADKNEKGTKEREEPEEGEILKVSDHSRGSLGGSVSREASVDVSGSQQQAPSQPSESTEISDDLRAKIRAMLMATRT